MCGLLDVLIPLSDWLQAIGVNHEIGILFGDLWFLEGIVKGRFVSGAGDGRQIEQPWSRKGGAAWGSGGGARPVRVALVLG